LQSHGEDEDETEENSDAAMAEGDEEGDEEEEYFDPLNFCDVDSNDQIAAAGQPFGQHNIFGGPSLLPPGQIYPNMGSEQG
jgi:hypothetical protein